MARREKGRAAVLLACGLACLVAQVVEAGQPDLGVVVEILNYAGLPGGTLERAESEAARVFGRAGVKLEWLEPEVATEGAGLQLAGSLQRAQVCYLKLLPDSMFGQLQLPTRVLGVARGAYIYVSVESALELSLAVGADLPVVLGHVMAHEIGHVLLGSNAHALGTVMTPQLGRRELQTAARGHLLFSQAQAKRMRERIQAQQAAETAVLVARK